MKTGLIDADLIANGGARFPNLALMKIAAINKKYGADAIDSALKRVEICARYGVKPYIMRYESTRQSEFASVWSGLAAWCNQPKQFKKRNFFQTNERRSLKAVDDARRLLPDRIVKTLETNLWRI